MANGIMQLRQSDTDELRITKINQNFLALLNSLGKGFSGFSLDNNNTGYYNALINRLEYDNVYADRFGAYIASADYLNVGTAWFNSASFQKAIADSLDVRSLIARTITVDTITAGEAEVDLLHAMYLQSTQAEFTEAQAAVLNSSLITAGNGVFQYLKSGSAYITTLNADYIKTGTLEFVRLVTTVPIEDDQHQIIGYKKYFARYNEETNQLVWDIQVDSQMISDNSVGVEQIANELVGKCGRISLSDGTFLFCRENEESDPVLSWDGSTLIVKLDSAYIKFNNDDNSTANYLADLASQHDTISGLDDRVSDITDEIGDPDDAGSIIGRIAAVESWFKMDESGLEIGRNDSDGVATLSLAADSVSLRYDNTTATLTSVGLEANQGVFNNSVRIGDFVLEQRAGSTNVVGHFSIKYIGGTNGSSNS